MSTVVIAGASGLIGTALADSLRADGVDVVRLVRRPARGPDEREWLTGAAPLNPDVLAGASAVVGVNGASIGRLPWTPGYRKTLRASRLRPTETLAAALKSLGSDAPPFLSGSAVGYYGSQPGVELDEAGSRGDTFLAELCVEWEAAARTAGASTRVVHLRTAPIVHPDGVLKPLMRLTALGVGGPIGRGTQIWPWISLDDEVRAIRHLMDADVEGPVNLSGPTAASANDLGRAVARAMHRPFWLRAPEWALRLGLGRAPVDSLLTSDAKVVPRVLRDAGFTFRDETVEAATAAVLG